MNVYQLQFEIASALDRDRTPSNSSGSASPSGTGRRKSSENIKPSTWSADYGAGRPTIKATGVDAARLHDDWSGGCDGSSWSKRKGRLDNGNRWLGANFWNEMIAALCPGTRNVIIGLGVLVFIVVA